MQIDRATISQWAADVGFKADARPTAVNALGKSVPIALLEHIAQRAAAHALKDLEIIVTDQGVNVIRDGVLVAHEAEGVEAIAAGAAERERDACAELAGDKLCSCCWSDDQLIAGEEIAAAIRART